MYSLFEKLIKPFEEISYISQSKVFDFLLYQSGGIKKYIFFIALFSTIAAATEVYIFQFLGDIVDSLKDTTSSEFFDENFNDLLVMTLILLVILPGAVVLRTLLEYQALEINYPLRVLFNLHGFLIKQKVSFFQQEPSGKIANTLNQMAFSTSLILVKLVNTFTFLIVFFISMGVLLTTIDSLLLVPVVIWVLGYIFIVFYFFPKVKIYLEKQAGAMSEMIGKLADTYNNIVTVKIFSSYKSELHYGSTHMGKYMTAAYQHMRIATSVQIVMWTINVLLIFGTFALSIYLWSKGEISVGAIAAAVAVSFRLYTMSHWIMWELLDVSRNIGVVQNGIKFIQASQAALVEGTEADIFPDKNNNEITFKNVSFSYDDKKEIIKNFSFSIRNGEKIGVVGASGTGKSTLAKLLLRLYECNHGKIIIDGKDIRIMSHDELLSKVSAVTQDVQLLYRSIRENLMYGNENISEERMVQAAKAAGAHDFICKIVDEEGRTGYDAHVGVGGAKLSGGQKQRVSLARALVKQADIYIFDEATSALDMETEAKVLRNIEQYLKGKTVIVIAHRQAALNFVDKLIRVEDGGLIEAINKREELFQY